MDLLGEGRALMHALAAVGQEAATNVTHPVVSLGRGDAAIGEKSRICSWSEYRNTLLTRHALDAAAKSSPTTPFPPSTDN
jgi:hypothetical protein